MNSTLIQRHFAKIGARAQVTRDRRPNVKNGVSIDIRRDADGEFFDIALGGRDVPTLAVLDTQPDLRHLLLMSRERSVKSKFLCGHDERHWFVAAVPERASASNVKTAFAALQPAAIRSELERRRVRRKNRNRRRNDAFVRQGEWFFVPAAEQRFDSLIILKNEPLRRGAGKPHICQELVRAGGELVYVSAQHPQGVTEHQYRRIVSRRPELRNIGWVTQRRNPQVFVRGYVRHADHKTITLDGWHQVLMNTETQALAMRHVAFID